MMGIIVIIFFIIFIASPSYYCAKLGPGTQNTFNVIDYGAVGNGVNDDTQAFLKAWKDVCGATKGIPTLRIPKGKTFMLRPVSFEGPCKADKVVVQLQGTLVATKNKGAWKDMDKWIQFSWINGLLINGRGKIDGQGSVWWKACTGKGNGNCEADNPTALHLHKCKGLRLTGLTHLNSARNHISISSCDGVYISNLNIVAPDESPNTDGIDIASSSHIVIQNSVMATGDDCIAINNGSSYINIARIACGPGHGISIGSLGKGGAYETVEEVHVRDSTFTGSQNGARIKTWRGGSGYARKITFERIKLINTENPIIIDQQYDPNAVDVDGNSEKSVKVSDVTFRDMQGSSARELAIDLNCDEKMGCTNIVLDHIAISSSAGKTHAQCNNVHGISNNCSPIVPCLSNKLL